MPAKDKKESANKKLQEKIFLKKENSWNTTKDHKIVFDLAEKYKQFLSVAKTERSCISEIIKSLKKSGFKDLSSIKTASTGDKIFKITKEKAVIASIIGKNKEQFKIIGAHCDSPRLDPKPNPLYEESNLGMMQTHYYGGIKKYQWVNTPLSIQGIIFTKEGKEINISLGEKEDEPIFLISDLLPHLAKDQMEKNARKVITGEDLKVIFGSIPINDKDIHEQIKFNILKKLNKDFGIVEEDFAVAELEFVPANKPRDVGMDRGLIAAYGQDDKICVFTELEALLSVKKTPPNTIVAMFVDKEEIGSTGNTGAGSNILHNFTRDYTQLLKLKQYPSKILEDSSALIADVTSAMDPIFREVHDPQNAAYLNRGVSIEKYGGAGGKYESTDASAKFLQELRSLATKNNIPYQLGENGRVDQGGGATIGAFLAKYGMDVVDCGPCILGMHSPYEVSSKIDVYHTYLFYKAFFETS